MTHAGTRPARPWRGWSRAGLSLLLCGAALASPPPAPAPLPTPPAPTAPLAPALTIPAPRHLQYTIRGRVSHVPYRASGTLQWAHDGQRYRARMEVRLFLLGTRVQSSQGRLVPGGLQPLRFVDRIREDRSVDFDYPAALMRFSQAIDPAPLVEGTQDQLSVFMQLGALVGSAPQRFPAGTALTVPTTGVNGPKNWNFVVMGPEKLSLPGGEQMAIKLMRAAPRSDELNAELWLAPALGWLPARIRLSQDNGDYIDQLWLESEAP